MISVPRKCPILFVSSCISSRQEVVGKIPEIMVENERNVGFVEPYEEKDSEVMEILGSKAEELWHQSLWNQMKDIVMFTGPAAGLWICGPLRILIDTAVVGQRSSLELAALGPGTVLCENVGHVFVFLSVATSNMVATSLAKLDKKEVQHQISILLFVGLACGFFTLFLTKSFGSQALIAFAGPNNAHLVPAANTYVQIRAIAWPAVLVGCVAQSASLGMKDSWAPLKALGAGTAINGIGDVVLCIYLSYGIAGAAWATMVSQVVAAYMMIEALNKKGYNALAISIPSLSDVSTIVGVAGPLFVALMSKVAFYVAMIYFATSMGTSTVAAHQVMMQVFTLFTIWGEPLSQTAQTFMPELIHGVDKSLKKARILLKSLVTIGAALGLVLGVIGILVPWLFPTVFTHDQHVIEKMQRVLVPYFIAIVVTPCTHTLEGTLVGGSDVRFLSISMTGCFSSCGLVLLILSNRGWGLPGCWWALAGFQWARFCVALKRLLSPNGVLFFQSQALSVYEPVKTEAT